MIRVEHVRISCKKTIVLEDVSFTMASRGFVSFCAEEAASSAMALLLGAHRVCEQGEVWFWDQRLTRQEIQRCNLRNSYVQGLFTDFQLLDNANVYENVTLGLSYPKVDVDELLKVWGMDRVKYVPVEDLEFIDQAKTVIIRCLLRHTRMLVFDACTSLFSRQEKDQLYQLLKRCSKHLLVVVCGDPVASSFATQIIECEQGHLISDSLAELEEEQAISLSSFHLSLAKKKAMWKDINQRSKWKYRMLFLCLLVSAMAINVVIFNARLDLVTLEESVLANAGQSAIQLEKQAVGDDGTIYQNRYEHMRDEDIAELNTQIKDQLIYSYRCENPSLELTRFYGTSPYSKDLYDYSILELENLSQMGFPSILGSFPTTYFEACISDITANMLLSNGYFEDLKPGLHSYEDVIGRTVVWYGRSLTITGILPSDTDRNLTIQTKVLAGNSSYNSMLYYDRLFVKTGFMEHHDIRNQLTFPDYNKRILYQNQKAGIDQIQVAQPGVSYYDADLVLHTDLGAQEAYLDFMAVYQLVYKDRYQDVLVNDEMTTAEKQADYYRYATTLIGKQIRLQAYRISDQAENSMVMDQTITIKGIRPASSRIFENNYLRSQDKGTIWLSEEALAPYLKPNRMIDAVFYQSQDPTQMRETLNFLNEHDYYHAFVSNSRMFQVFVVDIKQLRNVLLFIGILFFLLYIAGFLYLLDRSRDTHKKEMTIFYLFGARRRHLELVYLRNAMFNLLKYCVFAGIASLIGIYILVYFIYYEFTSDTQIPILSYIMIPVLFILIAWLTLSLSVAVFLQLRCVIDEYFNRRRFMIK